MGDQTDNPKSDEIAHRRDRALKRALQMPPKPHKPGKEKARKAQRQAKAKQSGT